MSPRVPQGYGISEEAMSTRIQVSPEKLRLFDPQKLGACAPRFRSLLRAIRNQKQSQILSLLGEEAKKIGSPIDVGSAAYYLSVLMLRDYVSFGHYPVVQGDRCYLVPVLEAFSRSEQSRQSLFRRLLADARNRMLAGPKFRRRLEEAYSTVAQLEY